MAAASHTALRGDVSLIPTSTLRERAKTTIMKTLLQHLNEQQPLDPFWLEVVNDKTPQSAGRLQRLCQDQRDGKVLRQKSLLVPLMTAPSTPSHKLMVVTPLAAALLFGRHDVFALCFDHCRRNERRLIHQMFHSSQHDPTQHLMIWQVLEQYRVLDPMWKDLRKNGENALVPTSLLVAQILVLLPSDVSECQELAQFLMDQTALALRRQKGAFSRFFSFCRYHIQTYLGPEEGELTSRPRKARLVPPLPRSLGSWVAHWSASEIVAVKDPILLQRLYSQFIALPDQPEFFRWARTHMKSLLAFMEHKINPYLMSLLPRPRRQSSRDVFWNQGKAFRVHRSCCDYQLLEHGYGLLRFQNHQFVVRHTDYEAYQGHHWLLMLSGAVTTAQTHPWIRQHFVRYHGQVSRLRFGTVRSDGAVLRWTDVQHFGPELMPPDPSVEVVDLTSLLHLKKRKSSLRRSRPERRIPWASACVLTPFQWRRLAPYWQHWSLPQRQLCYMLFWRVNGLAIVPYEDLDPDVRQNWIQMINVAFDWTDVHDRDELRRWVRASNLSFWQCWDSWKLHFSTPVQALCLAQQNDCPLLSIAQVLNGEFVVPGHTGSTLLGAICQLSHRLQTLWRPLVSPPTSPPNYTRAVIHNLMRMFMAPAFPAELRRVIWHSLHNLPIYGMGKLQLGHPLFPPSSCPVLTEAEAAALPRLFVQLQDARMVPERVVTVLVSRSTGYTVDGQQIEALRRQMHHQPLSMVHQIDLGFQHEPGRGPSVNSEVLQFLWSQALQKHLVRVLDEDATLCLTERSVTPDDIRALFELGFVSALCLSKGYHLPYPLHLGWWRYLATRPADMGHMRLATSAFFLERAEQKLSELERMSGVLRRSTFVDLVNDDPDMLTNEELIEACFLPQLLTLEAFCSGWDVCMSHIDLGLVLPHLNAMFCETQRLNPTVPRLVELWEVQHPHDAVLLRALEQLTPDQLQRLVRFITGKSRLPVLEMGEDRLRAAWDDSDFHPPQRLPRAQNCTSMLLMPPLPRPVTPETLLHVLRPLWEFDTVFGFL